ncbi:MAG: sensor histidine kinase, partial [Candidatus Hodarchaeales archaeon]
GTPITAINLSMQNIQKYGDRISKEQEKSIIEMIADSSQVLTQMIEDLLIASRIEAGKINLAKRHFKLLDIVQSVINIMTPKFTSKEVNIEVNIDENIQIYGDKDRIAQILRILVDNAIKYSPRGSSVIIRADDNYKVVHGSDLKLGVLIQVIDQGRGIKKEDIPYLFTKFFRASEVKNIGGTGIGLSIAKELAELHQGNIFVESTYNKGSTFSVFIPFKKQQSSN